MRSRDVHRIKSAASRDSQSAPVGQRRGILIFPRDEPEMLRRRCRAEAREALKFICCLPDGDMRKSRRTNGDFGVRSGRMRIARDKRRIRRRIWNASADPRAQECRAPRWRDNEKVVDCCGDTRAACYVTHVHACASLKKTRKKGDTKGKDHDSRRIAGLAFLRSGFSARDGLRDAHVYVSSHVTVIDLRLSEEQEGTMNSACRLTLLAILRYFSPHVPIAWRIIPRKR